MDTLTCPNCGTQFPNQPPYRRTGKYTNDVATCPNCKESGNPRQFMKLTPSPGIGIPLQKNPNEMTPAQNALNQMFQTAQNFDKKGLFKFADKLEKIILGYKK